MATVQRIHWVLATNDGLYLFTDHKNLIFLFDPLAVVTDLSQSSLRKVLRWEVQISAYNYTCVHIRGDDNVWVELLSRLVEHNVVRRLVSIPVLPSYSSPDFTWHLIDELSSVQSKFTSNRPANLTFIDELWKNPSGAV